MKNNYIFDLLVTPGVEMLHSKIEDLNSKTDVPELFLDGMKYAQEILCVQEMKADGPWRARVGAILKD